MEPTYVYHNCMCMIDLIWLISLLRKLKMDRCPICAYLYWMAKIPSWKGLISHGKYT
jgi:hypothetical protein